MSIIGDGRKLGTQLTNMSKVLRDSLKVRKFLIQFTKETQRRKATLSA